MKDKLQINLTLLHIAIGTLIAFFMPLSKVYALVIVLIGFYFVVKNKNKNNEILYVIAYLAGSEVFFRATEANPFHEFGKYLMLFFTFLGFFYSGFPKIKNPYWVYLLLLLPSICLSFMCLDGDFRRKISFEVLGPICLGVLALYTYKREISSNQINVILSLIGLPILASCIYLILGYSQNVHHINCRASNFYFSGEFAPNQTATALGLGLFIYLFKIILESGNKRMLYLNTIIFCLISYRALLTFSRGGVITGIVVVLTLFFSIYISSCGSYKLKKQLSLSLLILISVFTLTACQTNSLLFQRYTNLDLLYANDALKTKGRYIQVESDIKNFASHPIFGVGAGKGKEIRKNDYNINVSTHSEMTRLLSEHGTLGILALLILIFYPLRLYFRDLRNFYLLPFLIFCLFTINHSATRIIAPLFLYALTLTRVEIRKEEDTLILSPPTIKENLD